MCAVKMHNLDHGSFVSIAQQWKLKKVDLFYKNNIFQLIFDILKKRVLSEINQNCCLRSKLFTTRQLKGAKAPVIPFKNKK